MPSTDSDTKSKSVERFDEYTYFADSTQTLADRRQSATQVFIGVNTSIFGLIGFLLNDAGLSRLQDLVALPLFVVGVLICLVWDRMISHYRALIAWRFEQLRNMENELNGSSRCSPANGNCIFSRKRINQSLDFPIWNARFRTSFLVFMSRMV
ncbi:RipA family octameric membrane protein [Defluviicoccus vanus]|uniref:Uncharacterized protein n=1 Tax=Defluviicoccus vanus TaxID=111831 RepID=A0A7H1N4W9_9PROT|nr:hypothetical protein [Defluviicoccus vanus]QNT70755.1 hypothetical protein HQ394_17320 [Defluviicoccus vanus]